MSPRIRVAGVLLTGWLLTGPATALPPVGPVNVADLGDLAHRLFVADGERTALAVIDTAGDRLLGTLDIGLVPRQLAVSSALSRLVATDGRSGRVGWSI